VKLIARANTAIRFQLMAALVDGLDYVAAVRRVAFRISAAATIDRATAVQGTRYEDGGRTGSRSGTGHDLRGAGSAHSTHRQA
jgi:hypothetical protein